MYSIRGHVAFSLSIYITDIDAFLPFCGWQQGSSSWLIANWTIANGLNSFGRDYVKTLIAIVKYCSIETSEFLPTAYLNNY